jgi:hypothetical protein
MSEEEFEDMVEELVWKKVEEFNEAMAIGNYKRANELFDLFFLGFTEKNKSLEDVMVA